MGTGSGLSSALNAGPMSGATGLLLAGCSLASLINPYGIQLHIHIVEYLRADWIKNIVQEFQAPTFRNEGQLQYEALLLAGLILVGFLLRQRRFTEALWILFLAHASLISVRHAPIYATVAAPFIACELSEWWSASGGANEEVRRPCAFCTKWGRICRRDSGGPACGRRCLFLILVLMDAPIKWPRDFPSEMFPTAMVHKHAGLGWNRPPADHRSMGRLHYL